MKSFSFKLPDLGEGMLEAEIVEWKVKPGDMVEAEQAIVDMMTDKATVEMTSPVKGKVVSLGGKPGDTVNVGAELVEFDTDGNGALPEESGPVAVLETNTGGAGSEPGATPVKAQVAALPAGKVLTSPAIRRRAREHEVDLTRVPASGPNGRITREDLDRYLADDAKPVPAAREERKQQTKEIPVIGLRRKIAEKMAVSASHIPHFTYVEEVDMTELESLRTHLNEKYQGERPKLTYMPFIVQALVRVLEEFPQCNAHFDDERNVITRYSAVHAGVATQTNNGLMVPVVHHAEALDLWQCAAEAARVSGAARSGKAAMDELTGSSITITSLGALGGIVVTPVINYPEVAIIGVNKVQERPVVKDGVIVTRLMMNLSSSFDHRVVDGYDGARMIQSLKSLLEHPATIFI